MNATSSQAGGLCETAKIKAAKPGLSSLNQQYVYSINQNNMDRTNTVVYRLK